MPGRLRVRNQEWLHFCRKAEVGRKNDFLFCIRFLVFADIGQKSGTHVVHTHVQKARILRGRNVASLCKAGFLGKYPFMYGEPHTVGALKRPSVWIILARKRGVTLCCTIWVLKATGFKVRAVYQKRGRKLIMDKRIVATLVVVLLITEMGQRV